MKALFILKRREDYSTDLPNFQYPQVASGMFNSATFISDMIRDKLEFESKVITVVDNNCIDREVKAYKPTHVFIEGYWVVPEKFDVLVPLHPTVTWTIRCHSETPFLAGEGVAMEWTIGYVKRGIQVAPNSPRMKRELDTIVDAYNGCADIFVPLLPNYYPTDGYEYDHRPPLCAGLHVNVGCFGALRPLKNQLMQAIAAIAWAEKHEMHLQFHINAGRVEQLGQGALKNIRALFAALPRHHLHEHGWMDHDRFLKLQRRMDIVMQVSLTETFNIVSADALLAGTPIVGSSEIPFLHPVYADPLDSDDIVAKMDLVWKHRSVLARLNKERLERYSANSVLFWETFFQDATMDECDQAELEADMLAPPAWKRPFYELALRWIRK